MQFDVIEKVLTKLNRSYLVAKSSEKTRYGLYNIRWAKDTDSTATDFSFHFFPTRNNMEFESFLSEDIRKDDKIKFTAPEVGFFNDYQRKVAVALSRRPARAFKLGLSSETAVIKHFSNGDFRLSLDDICEEGYSDMLYGVYPTNEQVFESLTKNKWKSISLSKNSLLYKAACGPLVLNIGGSDAAWFYNGEVILVKGSDPEILKRVFTRDIKKLAGDLKDVV